MPKGNDLRVLTRFDRPNSLGLYYGMLTQYLGYQMTNDEYKVMGLSFALRQSAVTLTNSRRSCARRASTTSSIARWTSACVTGRSTPAIFRRDRSGSLPKSSRTCWGRAGCADNQLDQRFTDIAASGQKQLEIVTTQLVTREAIRVSGCPDVCLAGGVSLNCKMNMEIAAEPSVRKLYVPPVPHDAGVALGAAMLKCVESGHPIAPLTHAYWGPEYSNDTVGRRLDKIGARFELLDDPSSRCVSDSTEQKTVGWFQGRMEYGPRALGNRSILADPRSADMKDQINITHQISRGISSVLPVGAVRSPGRIFRRHV